MQREVIRHHYNISTLFYRLLWGPHIHHGLWHGEESSRQAQLQLTQTLIRLAKIAPESKVVDIGCGMGGSSIYLAKELRCDVTGVTISPVQRLWASTASRLRGTSPQTRFLCQDAEQVQLPAGSLDAVWSIECTEHLFDKAAFFRKAAGWLRPGGCVAICAWLAGDTEGKPANEQQVKDVCEGFFCPSLGTAADYVGWLESAGLTMEENQDWTRQVDRTWEICKHRVQWTGMPLLAKFFGADAQMFVGRFDAILNAYRSGAMAYGCFVARKPLT